MTPIASTSAGRWFRRVLWVGVVANLALSLPTLISPAAALEFGNYPPAAPLMWPQFSGLLLILLSVFYMPAGVDPDRYRVVAWMAVGARLAGVIFFLLIQPPEYRFFGLFDLVFFVPELALLTYAVRAA